MICILSIISIASILFCLKQKNDNELLNKDIVLYEKQINELENEINSYDSKKEQVQKELVSNLDENKKKEYEVWKKQTAYLQEVLK